MGHLSVAPAWLLCACVAFVAPSPFVAPSRAADLSAPGVTPLSPGGNGWIVTLRANAGISNDWEGAGSYGPLAYPSISFRRADTPREWGAPDDGYDFSLFDSPYFSVGPVARYRAGRYRADDRQRLFGIHDMPWTVEPGVFAEFWPIPNTLRARVELRHGLDSHDGFVADAAIDYLLHFGQATFAFGPRFAAIATRCAPNSGSRRSMPCETAS